MEKVKVVKGNTARELEEAVNSELRSLPGNLIDIKYQVVATPGKFGALHTYSAMILYRG